MQTNREDCGTRYREVILPVPKNKQWAETVSIAFRNYFAGLAQAKIDFLNAVASDKCEYIASVSGMFVTCEDGNEDDA